MSTSKNKSGGLRRVLMAGVFVATGALGLGVAMTPAAHAQTYPYQYNNPYYSTNPYGYGYWHHAWWRRHEYWRWYHQYYGR
jgi:hypothetical protein